MNIILENNLIRVERVGADLLCEHDPIKVLKDVFTVTGLETEYGTSKFWFFRKNTLPAGLFDLLIKVLKAHNIKYNIYDYRSNLFKINKIQNLKNYIYSDFQIGTLKLLLEPTIDEVYYPRGIVNAATNSGKSIIIAGLLKSISQDKSVLIVVHRDLLHSQMIKLLNEENIDFGIITSKKTDIKRITIAMEKTLMNRLDLISVQSYVNKIDCVLLDECHIAKAKKLYNFFSKLSTNMIYFMSGTAIDFDNYIDKLKVIGLSGKVLANITVKQLVETGKSRVPNLFFCEVPIKAEVSNYRLRYLYNIIKNEYRHQLIMDNCIGQTIISVKFKDHAHILQDFLEKNNKRATVFSSESDNYNKVIDDFKNEKTQILIATSVIKEGLNIPNIDTMINAGGGKSKIFIKQAIIGRATRKKLGHSSVRLVDFNDLAFPEHTALRKSFYEEIA